MTIEATNGGAERTPPPEPVERPSNDDQAARRAEADAQAARAQQRAEANAESGVGRNVDTTG